MMKVLSEGGTWKAVYLPPSWCHGVPKPGQEITTGAGEGFPGTGLDEYPPVGYELNIEDVF